MDELRRRELALAEDVAHKTRIYLDLKYWIYCRDARAGTTTDAVRVRLYDLLNELVSRGLVICPLDGAVLREVLKQRDPVRLSQVAAVVDELSLGVCFKPFVDRVRGEILHFLYRCIAPDLPLHERECLVWTKVGYAFGAFDAHNERLSAQENRLINEAFLDRMWSSTAAEFIESLSPSADEFHQLGPDYLRLAHDTTMANAAYADAYVARNGRPPRWREIYEAEVRGMFDVLADDVWDAAAYLQSRVPNRLPATPARSTERALRLAGALATAFLTRDLWRAFPGAHIPAMLHTRVRHDRGRRIHENDFLDFQHACAALPYCSAFFTERSLTSMLNTGTPSLAKQFGVTVLADPNDAVTFLRAIAALAN